MILEPTILPFLSISCPLARSGNSTCANPVTPSGYRNPKITVVTKVNQNEMRRFFFISSSNHPKIRQQYVDELDSDERRNNSAYAVDQQIALQQGRRAERTIAHATERKRDESHNNQSVENHGREDCRFRRVKMHYIQNAEDGKSRGEHRGYDREVFGNVVSDRERGECAARDQQLLADFDNLDELGGVGVEIHHVAGFLGRLRARVHGHSDIRLSESWSVVRAVAGHGHKLPLGLFTFDERHLVFRLGFGEKIVDAGLAGDRSRGQGIDTRDPHRTNAHGAKVGETLLHAPLDDVRKSDRAQHADILRNQQRRASAVRNDSYANLQFARNAVTPAGGQAADSFQSALTDFPD